MSELNHCNYISDIRVININTMTVNNGKLGELNPGFQSDECVVKSSEKYLNIELDDMKDDNKRSKKYDDTEDMFDDKDHQGNIVGDVIEKFWEITYGLVEKHWTVLKICFLVMLAVLYNAYLVGSIHYASTRHDRLDYCDDVGFLLIITIIVYIFMFYFLVIKPYSRRLPIVKQIYKSVISPGIQKSEELLAKYASYGAYSVILLIFAIFILVDTADDPRRLVSALGILVLVGLGFICSKHPGKLTPIEGEKNLKGSSIKS